MNNRDLKNIEFREINPLLPRECIIRESYPERSEGSAVELKGEILHSVQNDILKKARVGLLVWVILAGAPAFAAYSNIQTPEDKILSKGFASYMDGNDKAALSYFEEVIRLNPRNSAAQKGLEKVKIRLKKIEEANHQKAKWLAKSKYNEGRGLMKSADLVAAIDAFQAALDATPGHKGALSEMDGIKKRMLRTSDRRRLNLSTYAYSRGVIAYLERDWAKAWRIWSERLLLEPNNVPLANATARAETKFKRMMLAEQEDFFRRGARAFYSQGLYRESESSWTKVLALRPDDVEALEGKARSEEAILRAEGRGKDDQIHDLLEQGLEFYASQNWRKSLLVFQQISEMDPSFNTAKEYIAKLNGHLASSEYSPVSVSQGENWRANKPSNQGPEAIHMPDNLENFAASEKELRAQLNRDPGNIRLQQELDNVTRRRDEESERLYKDGLIAYSQGNRQMAIQVWNQVLVVHPDHKKATAALKKAKAEEERTAETESQ